MHKNIAVVYTANETNFLFIDNFPLTKKDSKCYNYVTSGKLINEESEEQRMKRIQAACIIQTLHFMLKEGVGHDYAVALVKEEVEKYKKQLEKSHTKYKILSETTQEDGSVVIEIKKQYTTSPVGNYFD